MIGLVRFGGSLLKCVTTKWHNLSALCHAVVISYGKVCTWMSQEVSKWLVNGL